MATDGLSLRERNVAVGGWYLPVCLSPERDVISAGPRQVPPMVKAIGWVFDGPQLAPGSSLVSASVEPGACEVMVG